MNIQKMTLFYDTVRIKSTQKEGKSDHGKPLITRLRLVVAFVYMLFPSHPTPYVSVSATLKKACGMNRAF